MRLSVAKYLNNNCRISKVTHTEEFRRTDYRIPEIRIRCQIQPGLVNDFYYLIEVAVICHTDLNIDPGKILGQV